MDIITNDYNNICNTASIDWLCLKHKTVLVTGGTGLIGSTLVNALAVANREKDLDLKIVCVVRNIEKAKRNLDPEIVIMKASIEEKIDFSDSVDYIIHAASPTASLFFVSNPVDTIRISVNGTTNLLEFAKEKKVEGFVYLSSMEVYGCPKENKDVSEKDVGGFDTMIARNSYPQSKQLCEMLCKGKECMIFFF